MYDVDVHIIHFNESQDLLDKCIASLEGQPVNIHIVKGFEEWPPYESRKKGFASGSAKYCSFVDPDDEVMPGAYEELLKYSGADLIWGNELVITRDRDAHIHKGIHHAYLVKRNLSVQHYLEFRAFPNAFLKRVHVNKVLYTWNMYLGTKQRRRDGNRIHRA